jgi:hypothetical protein
LNRPIGLVALFSLFACGAKVSSMSPTTVDVATLASSTVAAARALEKYYQAENDGTSDAYSERSQAHGLTAGRTETCRLPTGALSKRPTVLANPPISPSAIRQREALVAAIGAYLSTLMAVAGGSSTDVISASLADLKSQTVHLQKAANEHDQGDLFVEDAAAELGNAIDGLKIPERAQMTRKLHVTDAIVRHLTAILAADVARQRVDTIDATTLAYDVWLSRLHATRSAGDHLQGGGPPFCSEPAIFDRSGSQGDGAKENPSLDPRGAQLRYRMNAARGADPASVLRAMTELDIDEMCLLDNPGDVEDAAEATAGRERLKRVADAFAHTSSAFEPVDGSRRPP